MKYNIAIVGKEAQGVFGVDVPYMQFVQEFGNANIITPGTPLDYIKSMDAILLPGGLDVDPKRYGVAPDYRISRQDPHLEAFDIHVLPYLIGKVKLIGICRGIQTLNVQLGGNLYPDIVWYKRKDTHVMSRDGNDMVHKIRINVGNGRETIREVNSFHHQAVHRLAPALTAVAWSIPDGYVEAVESRELGIFAVQWHPERMWKDEWTMRKIAELLEK